MNSLSTKCVKRNWFPIIGWLHSLDLVWCKMLCRVKKKRKGDECFIKLKKFLFDFSIVSNVSIFSISHLNFELTIFVFQLEIFQLILAFISFHVTTYYVSFFVCHFEISNYDFDGQPIHEVHVNEETFILLRQLQKWYVQKKNEKYYFLKKNCCEHCIIHNLMKKTTNVLQTKKKIVFGFVQTLT